MLIELPELIKRHDVDVTRVLHLGAHLGEEADAYVAAGAEEVWWVEANPAKLGPLFENVGTRKGHHVIPALLGATVGSSVKFYIANNGESSSTLQLGTHKTEHKEVRYTGKMWGLTTTVDEIIHKRGIRPTFINIDLQGVEGPVLAGAVETIHCSVDDIYAEVNEAELYKGCTLIGDLDAQLDALGFRRTQTKMTRHHWGDALYTRRLTKS